MKQVVLGEITEGFLRSVAELNTRGYTHIPLSREEVAYYSVLTPSRVRGYSLDGVVLGGEEINVEEVRGQVADIIQNIDSVLALSILTDKKLDIAQNNLNAARNIVGEEDIISDESDLYKRAFDLKKETLSFSKRHFDQIPSTLLLHQRDAISGITEVLREHLGNLAGAFQYRTITLDQNHFIKVILFNGLDKEIFESLAQFGTQFKGPDQFILINEADLGAYAAISQDFYIAGHCGRVTFPLDSQFNVPEVSEQETLERMLYANVSNARKMRGAVANDLGGKLVGKRNVANYLRRFCLKTGHSIHQFDNGRTLNWRHFIRERPEFDLTRYSHRLSRARTADAYIEANLVLSRRIGDHVRHQVENETTLGEKYDAVLRRITT